MVLRKAIDGDAAVAEGVRLARVQAIAAYPITPQTPIVENISEYVNRGELEAKYIAVESEHSALTAVVGSALVGARSFTATAGVGLALMHEITGVASGCRLPIVMAVANRSLPSPWSLQTDHSDAMGERDQGWIQLYAENCQEALDLVLVAYRLAEDERVRIPVMVCLDGFYVSHTTEVVSIPDQQQVDRYLPSYKNQNLYLDVEEPFTVNQLTSADVFTEIKYEHYLALENSLQVLEEVGAEFKNEFGRNYGAIAQYAIDDAETIIVAMGSIAGTALQVAKELREQGKAVGLVKVTSFRPFPKARIREALAKAKKVVVIDRSAGMGSEGPLAMEIKSALYGSSHSPAIYGFCGGLGGRDFTRDTIVKTLEKSNELQASGINNGGGIWIDVKEAEVNEK
ncbi:transketolase C-terminal domain-containing protein [Desulfitobacterium sp. AusDCA]|uniref:transketolase C-terminal domain-containing protein n=1 Tax=Desulfitobacterium sp. AusDCA TaxID=3240383 RepID=UPI003DA75914